MATDRFIIPGIVRNGVVVPQGATVLPEGARVEIALPVAAVPPDLQAEFDAWERLGDEAWGFITEWEKAK